MCKFKITLVATSALSVWAFMAQAQSPKFGVGRTPSEQEIRNLSISIPPDGRGLPPGGGNAVEGKKVYDVRCTECHGPEAKGADEGGFVGKPAQLLGDKPSKTIGSYWPYATTVWDYINRAMPFDRPGTLTHDQVYAVTAYILQLNGLIAENDRLDAESLPKIEMPNRNGFIPDARPDVAKPAK